MSCSVSWRNSSARKTSPAVPEIPRKTLIPSKKNSPNSLAATPPKASGRSAVGSWQSTSIYDNCRLRTADCSVDAPGSAPPSKQCGDSDADEIQNDHRARVDALDYGVRRRRKHSSQDKDEQNRVYEFTPQEPRPDQHENREKNHEHRHRKDHAESQNDRAGEDQTI